MQPYASFHLCLFRDIYYARYYGKGGGWPLGKKIGVREKMKKGKEGEKMHLFGL